MRKILYTCVTCAGNFWILLLGQRIVLEPNESLVTKLYCKDTIHRVYYTWDIFLVLNTKATPSKNSPSTDAVQPKKDKVLLDKMSKDFDEQLSSGSKLRLVCPTCNTPCAFLYNERSCHSCKSELVVWCWNINTGFWTKPRMPPNKNIRGPYIQCKHFFGKGCVKSPCGFAHGDDELETWELLRGKRKFSVIKS